MSDIKLVSDNETVFKLPHEKGVISEVIKELIEVTNDDEIKIDLKYSPDVIQLTINYINTYFEKKHEAELTSKEFLPEKELNDNKEYVSEDWELKFIPDDKTLLIKTAELAYDLAIIPLKRLLFNEIAKLILDKTHEEVEDFFNIEPFNAYEAAYFDEKNKFINTKI